MNLDDMRESYDHHDLDKESMPSNPYALFASWIDKAIDAKVPEPNAMSLATSTIDGEPSSRIVLLKGFSEEQGFIFYTNYKSRKGIEIAQNPNVALCFWWPQLHRQVRIEGKVYTLNIEKSNAYFNSRPEGSRKGAILSPQSQVIPNRQYLKDQLSALDNKTGLLRPDHWGGYGVMPRFIEFWQGRSNRLHDRFRYSLESHISQWALDRLAP